MSRRPPLTLDSAIAGIRGGDRAVLARAITLVESTRPDHRRLAEALLSALMPHTGAGWRVGITGVPGVGKSTFIETLGVRLLDAGHRVAVLAIDPTSSRTGGSILGDKTRMGRLSIDPRAFVRPSPTRGALGGVAARTRETLLLCEAAGHDVVLVETVGVGQSETVVAEMTDTFLLLALPGAGDELQGIKRGLMELADVVAVNKADGDNRPRAERAAHELRAALRVLHPQADAAGWRPSVLTCSGQTGDGVQAVWQAVADHRAALVASGHLGTRRTGQHLRWLWQLVEQALLDRLHRSPAVAALLHEVESAVRAGTLAPPEGARRLLDAFSRTVPSV